MDLAQYLKEKGIKKGFFAEKVGISAETLTNIIQGKAFTIITAMAIEEYTNKEVTVMDLINNFKEEHPPRKKRKKSNCLENKS